MKKLILFLAFSCLVLAAPRPTQDDFNTCYEKNKGSIISVNGNYGVAITPELIAVVKNSDTPINDYIKFDPYLGLYLVKSNKRLEPPVMADENDEANFNKTTWIGTLSDNNNSLMGHVKAFGIGLGELDRLSFDANMTAQLNLACCCKLAGIAVGLDKFIPNRYLKHFVAYEDVYYGDIGVTFEQRQDGFFVGLSDPLGRGKALMVGDEILNVNGDKPKSLRLLNESVLFAPKGTMLEFKIKRRGEELKFHVPVSGEVALKDNKIDEISPAVNNLLTRLQNQGETAVKNSELDMLLENWGIVLDTELRVTKVIEGSAAFKFGIVVGDKVLQVNNEIVKTPNTMMDKIGKQRGFLLLFERGGFDFFARVTR